MAFPDEEIAALKVAISDAIAASAAAAASTSSGGSIDGASVTASSSSSSSGSSLAELIAQLERLEDYKAKHSPFEVMSRWIPR